MDIALHFHFPVVTSFLPLEVEASADRFGRFVRSGIGILAIGRD